MTDEINGRVTDGTRGLPGVAVSDGLHVTTTDDDGRFALRGHGPFAIVTRPTRWTTNDWYLPAGRDLEFTLSPVEQPVPFTFVQVTDLHVSLGATDYGPGQGDATIYLGLDGGIHERVITSPAVLDDLWRDVARRVPDASFVAATGDLTNTGSDDEYAAWVTSVATSPIPVVSIPGNHDHHAQGDELPDDVAADFHAETSRYDAHLGPRWFSFDHGGVHVVAIDWFTHLLGIDRDDQEAWLQADLAAIDPETPVVLLSHDQMPTDFFDRLPRRPVATFSGHWHTSRVVRVGETLHVNTPTATFGGLDYSPAAMRAATWDGQDLSVRTITRTEDDTLLSAGYRATSVAAAPTRVAGLPGAGHRAAPVVLGDLVIAATRDEDAARGWLTAVDRASGEVAWQSELDHPVKAGPRVVAGTVVVTDVTGTTHRIAADGTELWRTTLDDPLRLWAYLRPGSDGQRVFVGDVARFVALDVETGQECWSRQDLGQRENLTSFADPIVVDGTLVVGFAGQTPVLWGLDPATGGSRWPQAASGASIYRQGQEAVVAELPRTLVAPPVADPDGSDLYVVRLGAMLERIRAVDGASVWLTGHHGWFNPGSPALLGDLVVAGTGMGLLRAYDRASGAMAWEADLGGKASLAAGAYRADGPLALAGLVTEGDGVLTALGDGRVLRADHDGSIDELANLGAPAFAELAVVDDEAWAITVDGGLHRLAL